jgi:uncharacterized protein YjbJ (UPF0337 family)
MTNSNATPIAPNWNEQKGKLKTKFAILTDADVSYAEGKKDDMITRLQIKLGKTKEELVAIIATL